MLASTTFVHLPQLAYWRLKLRTCPANATTSSAAVGRLRGSAAQHAAAVVLQWPAPVAINQNDLLDWQSPSTRVDQPGAREVAQAAACHPLMPRLHAPAP